MKIDGVDLVEGYLIRANIEHGETLPDTDLRTGRLFILTEEVENDHPGLYCYNGSAWRLIYVGNNDNTIPVEDIEGIGPLASAESIDNNTWSGDPLSVENGGTNANNAADARTNLGLGNSATLDVGTTSDTVAAGDHTHEDLIVNATITQVEHGFTTGTPIYVSSQQWSAARANNKDTVATHIAKVIDADTFVAMHVGLLTLQELTPGAWYYVSTEDAGELVTIEPTTGFSNPVGQALDSTTLMVMLLRAIPATEPVPPAPEVWIDVTGPEFWEDYNKDNEFWDYSNYEWDSGNERWRLTEPATDATAALLRPISGWEIGLRFSRFRITLNSGTNINSGILSEGTEVGLRVDIGQDITNSTEAVFSNWNEEVVLELTIKTDVDNDLDRLGMSTYLYNDGPYITKIEYQPI